MSGRRAAGKPGLTLIELIFAVSVIAVALLAIASMFPTALRALVAGGNETRATALARGMVDLLRTEPFDRLADAVPSGYNGFSTTSLSPTCPVAPPASPDPDSVKKKWACEVAGGGALGSPALPGGVGTVGVVCLNPDGSTGTCSSTDLRRLAVTVSWQLGQGLGTRAIVLVTYVARQE